MIRYRSTRQMSIEEFRTPFQVELDRLNRWVKLGNSYPKGWLCHNRENRKWLKYLDIRYFGIPLGRPSSRNQTPYRKRKFKEEQGMRNQVVGIHPFGKGKFGKGKKGYNLSKVRARAAKTSESWIAAIFFVMNLVRFSKIFLFSFLKVVLGAFFSDPNIFVHRQNENIAFKI